MGLIKIAGIFSFILPSIPGTIMTKSGNPLKFIMAKNEGPLSPRKAAQRLAASTFSNSVNKIRNGKVADSTKLLAAYGDEFTGHSMQVGLNYIDDGYRKKGMAGHIIRHIVDQTVDNEGKYNIKNVEKYLKRAKKINSVMSHVKKYPYEYAAGAGTGAVQSIKAYNAEEDITKKRKAAIKGGIKGFAEGTVIGKALKAGSKKVQNKIISKGALAHDIYFEDDYWRKNLLAANNNKFFRGIGRVGAHLFTADPEKRIARVASSEARDKLINGRKGFSKGLVKNFFSKEGRKVNEANFKDYMTKAQDKFRSTDTLKKKYGTQPKKETKLKTFIKQIARYHGDIE